MSGMWVVFLDGNVYTDNFSSEEEAQEHIEFQKVHGGFSIEYFDELQTIYYWDNREQWS